MNKDLKDLIIKKFGSFAELAIQLKWSPRKMHALVMGWRVPNIYESMEMAEALGMTIDEFGDFF